jgi:hypothetical protein
MSKAQEAQAKKLTEYTIELAWFKSGLEVCKWYHFKRKARYKSLIEFAETKIQQLEKEL